MGRFEEIILGVIHLIYSAVPLKRGQFSHKYPQKTPQNSPVRARYGVSFVDPVSNSYSASISVIINVIPYNIEPCYNGTCSTSFTDAPLRPSTICIYCPSVYITTTAQLPTNINVKEMCSSDSEHILKLLRAFVEKFYIAILVFCCILVTKTCKTRLFQVQPFMRANVFNRRLCDGSIVPCLKHGIFCYIVKLFKNVRGRLGQMLLVTIHIL